MFENLVPVDEFPDPQPEKQKRTRRAKAKPKTDTETLKTFSANIMVFSALIAGKSGIQELAIGEDESNALTSAVALVIAEYDFTPDAKTQAWINLAAVTVSITAPRVMMYKARKAEEKKKLEDEKDVNDDNT